MKLKHFIMILWVVMALAHNITNADPLPQTFELQKTVTFTKNSYQTNRFVDLYKVNEIKLMAKHYDILPEDLLAICLAESTNCNTATVGDHGQSFGAFQIYSFYHGWLGIDNLRDFSFSLNWTAKRLIAKGYNRTNEWQRRQAISAHNGGGERAYWYGINRILTANQIAHYFTK